MQQGYHIFSPIAHNYVIAKAVGLDMGWAKWGEYDTKFLTACGQLWIGTLEGWRESVGVNHEIEIMQRQKKPIWLVDEYSLRLTLL